MTIFDVISLKTMLCQDCQIACIFVSIVCVLMNLFSLDVYMYVFKQFVLISYSQTRSFFYKHSQHERTQSQCSSVNKIVNV